MDTYAIFNLSVTQIIKHSMESFLQESVDTPMVERRKSSNWFSRQITRMGSMRSSSTAYSSSNIFKRNRHNSVYSSPEADGGLPGQQLRPSINNKMKLYDKFPRKSGRNLKHMMKRGKCWYNFLSQKDNSIFFM